MDLSSSYHNTTKPDTLMEIVDKVAALVKKLREDRPSITHIVATGSSGQSVAWPVSYKIGLPVCIVRKPAEESHAGLISGTGDLGDYIIIDDLISSGASVRRVVKALDDEWSENSGYSWAANQKKPVCVGIVLYQSDRGVDDTATFNTAQDGQPACPVRVYGDNYSRAW